MTVRRVRPLADGPTAEDVTMPVSVASNAAGTAIGLPESLIEAALAGAPGLPPASSGVAYAGAATAAGAAYGGNSAVPAVTVRLERYGRQTTTLETNVARSPIFAPPTRHGLQLALEWEPVPLYGRRFTIRSLEGPLTPRDERLLADVHTRYVHAGCPPDRLVSFSLGEAARLLGHRGIGGRNRELVKETLRRVRAIQLESTLRYPDGHEEALGWGLVDWWRTTTRGGGRGALRLSEPIAELIRAGSVTFLHGPAWEALLERDELAARLWTFLEAEDLSRGWRYALFSAPPGQPARERDMPALTDLLRLRDPNRSRVAARIRAACAAIVTEDPRYRLAVVKSKEAGMWRLEAARSRRKPRDPDVSEEGTLAYTGRDPGVYGPVQNRGVPSSSTVVSTEDRDPLSANAGTRGSARRRTPRSSREAAEAGLPDVAALLEVWPKVSAAQLRTLAEIADRHDRTGREWAAAIVRETPAGADPLEAVLVADRKWQAERRAELEAEAEAEAAWQRAKEAEREELASRVTGDLARLLPAMPAAEAPAPLPRPTAPADPETEARRRREAVELLRSGLAGPAADRLRADYGIGDEELL
jgi:hypothetical protein